jgi:hypothetical protein
VLKLLKQLVCSVISRIRRISTSNESNLIYELQLLNIKDVDSNSINEIVIDDAINYYNFNKESSEKINKTFEYYKTVDMTEVIFILNAIDNNHHLKDKYFCD